MTTSSQALFFEQAPAIDGLKADILTDRIHTVIKHLVKLNLENNGSYYEYEEIDKSIDPIKNQLSKIPYISETLKPYVLWTTNSYIKNFYGIDLNLFDFIKIPVGDGFQLDFQVNINTERHISIILLFCAVAFSDKFISNSKNKIVINQLQNILN